MITAFSGTMSERNTIINSRNDTASTAPMNIGSRSLSVWPSSSNAAVAPPTKARTPVPAVAAGSTLVSSRLMRSTVFWSWGDVVGKTIIWVTSDPAFSGIGPMTWATPSVDRAASASAGSAAAPAASGTLMATNSGPLNPFPNPSDSRS